MLLCVLVNFVSCQNNNRHKGCSYMSCCGDCSEIYIKSPSSSCKVLRKGHLLVLSNLKSEGWKNIGKVSLESCSQILEDSGSRLRIVILCIFSNMILWMKLWGFIDSLKSFLILFCFFIRHLRFNVLKLL